ncbi:light- and oxygen-sensing histidine kinase [Halorubrum coriense DSM 10284]|uniref:Light-and oxygen-sensing histidine kinase n=1 Tax=Halorubrum coriense DSM 10284 TaxID=1227466 RepID=M0EBB8_9EURY|nr:ATPase, T2SS/T4P/T4SS family [Halorubrum coriense]ELZ44177.1 light- and oxygen-sensing histidine kinase [Halorubrum coriense DSM 10284]
MTGPRSPLASPERLLSLSAELNGAETVSTAIGRTTEFLETVFDRPAVSVCAYDATTETVTALRPDASSSSGVDGAPDRIPESIGKRVDERGDESLSDGAPEAAVDDSPPEPLQSEILVPVGGDRVLRVGLTEVEGPDDADVAVVEGIAANLERTLSRVDPRRSPAAGCDVARALFDRSDDPTFVSDADGTLVAVNRAAVELTGRDRRSLLGSRFAAVLGDSSAAVREHLDDAAAGASEPVATTFERARGGDLRVELASHRVDVDGTAHVRTVARGPSRGAELHRGRRGGPVGDDAAALRRLSELAVDFEEFDEAIERLLSLGCDHFGLDAGVLARVDGDDYEVDTAVDATGTHEAGAVYDLADTMCDATLAGDAAEPLAFADVAETDHRDHPAADSVVAYIGAPVVVGDGVYGTVNFSMRRPRVVPFRAEEREFVKLIAKWLGTEIRRRERFEELERYETILEAVDDPVYALDTEGRFTYVNDAAKREFGYGTEIVGERPSVGMKGPDVALAFFQAMATGHTACTTLHADSIGTVLSRLQNPPLQVPEQMIQELDIVCVQRQVQRGETRIRRNTNITEIGEGDGVQRNQLYRWDPTTDEFDVRGESRKLESLRRAKGWSATRLQAELRRRARFLAALVEADVRTYERVSAVIEQFQRRPEETLARVRSGAIGGDAARKPGDPGGGTRR